MSTSADLGIEYIAGQQAQPEITHNSALNQLQILQTGVISVALNTPPGSPAQGDSYILGASPTGAWSGRANCLAGYFGTGWVFVPGNNSAGTPIAMGVRQEGLRIWSKADDKTYVWSGSAWTLPVAAPPIVTTNAGTSITLALTDASTFLRTTAATAVAITVPPQSSVTWPADTEIRIQQGAAGAVTISAGAGVTVNRLSTATDVIVGQYGVVTLKRTASDVWTLYGQLG
jgi:hypothetical protein